MAKLKKSKYHIEGQQPMFPPDSNWTTPDSLPDLRQHKLISLDRETKDDGLATKKGPGWAMSTMGYVCGVSVGWEIEGGRVAAAYFPVQHPDSQCFDREQIRQWEIDHQKAGVTFVMQNAPYDVGWGNTDLKVPVPENIHDTACMAYMIDENLTEYNLDALCDWQSLPGKNDTLLNEAAAAFSMDPKRDIYRMPARYVGPYAEQDARATLTLFDRLERLLVKQEVWEAYRLEMDLVPLVHAMRKRGIRMNEDTMDQAVIRFRKESQEALDQISDRLSMTVTMENVRSNEWLTDTFTRLRLPFPVDPMTGHNSFRAQWMKSDPHWLTQLLVIAKSRDEAAEKFINNYLRGFLHKGKLHASVNQFKSEQGGGTRTFRFSYDSPPLQQMPKRDDDLAKIVRGCFLPEKGQWWMTADYSQQEYRLIVHYAMAMELAKAEEAGQRYIKDPKTDFHQMVADMTGLRRKEAKDANFAKSYGAGVAKFAAMIKSTAEAAKSIMNQYDEKLPFVKVLYDKCREKAERRGYIKLLDGARIHFDYWAPWRMFGDKLKVTHCRYEEALRRTRDPNFPDWFGQKLHRSSVAKAMNSLIQGGAARQTKMAMRACWRAGYVPLLQVHDELDFSITSEKEGKEITEIMRDVVRLNVPMLVDAEYGPTWGAAVNSWVDRNNK